MRVLTRIDSFRIDCRMLIYPKIDCHSPFSLTHTHYSLKRWPNRLHGRNATDTSSSERHDSTITIAFDG